MGLRDEREGDRLLRRLLGEREREVSEGVKDLSRSSPRLELLLSLLLSCRRRGGVRVLLRVCCRRLGRGESSSRYLRRGGVLEGDRNCEFDRDLLGVVDLRRLSSDQRPPRPRGI